VLDGQSATSAQRDAATVILGVLECVRRFQWNFFRLENEHLNNCGRYRITKEIPLPFEFVVHQTRTNLIVHHTLTNVIVHQILTDLVQISFKFEWRRENSC
jgi:hypothetical protein